MTLEMRKIYCFLQRRHIIPRRFPCLRGKEKTEWEQCAGMQERGRPQTLVLWKTNSTQTVKNAPGPGAIKKTDWKPMADRYLKNQKIILHTDSARSYKMKIPGVLHDAVVHSKKKIKKAGKWIWTNPTFTRLVKHQIPGGSIVHAKGGAQIIDRLWQVRRDAVFDPEVAPQQNRMR